MMHLNRSKLVIIILNYDILEVSTIFIEMDYTTQKSIVVIETILINGSISIGVINILLVVTTNQSLTN